MTLLLPDRDKVEIRVGILIVVVVVVASTRVTIGRAGSTTPLVIL